MSKNKNKQVKKKKSESRKKKTPAQKTAVKQTETAHKEKTASRDSASSTSEKDKRTAKQTASRKQSKAVSTQPASSKRPVYALTVQNEPEKQLFPKSKKTADHQSASSEEKTDTRQPVSSVQPEKKPESAQKQTGKKPKKKMRLWKKVLLWTVGILLVAAAAGCIYGISYYESLIKDAPELDLSKRDNYSKASTVYDYEGNYVATYGANENIDWVSIDDVPDTLKNAFISIEDQRFYSHNGIDIKRLTGAVFGQLTGKNNYGASTITQQLVKNVYLTSEKTYKRKAQEIHLALELEKKLSKDEILEWYLNIIYLGDSNYGIKVAAQDYFGKDLDQLSLRECAVLAGLVQSPNDYNPRTGTLSGDMSASNKRTDNVLYSMYKNKYITKDEYEAALNDTTVVKDKTERYPLYDYPTYVEYAVKDAAVALLKQEGTEVTDDSILAKKQEIRNDGYQIYTAFHPDMQDTAQDAITNFNNYPRTSDGSAVEASAVIMDQHTGEVVAMVGGRSEPTEPEGFNRATDSTQAVGSSIKPLSVYAPALETGDYPGTTVRDTEESIAGYGEDDSYPNGESINGPITMRRALELSHNIPAARFLLEHVGLNRSYEFMVKEGFDPSHLSETAAGLGLGATDVTVLEMTGGYATLANGGVYIQPHAYTSVKDRDGNTLLDESTVETHRVFSESTAWLITDMMETNMTEGLGVNARLTNMTCAGKTGTHEHQVITFGGYTPYYTSFLRISSDKYITMTNSSSYYQSSVLWKNYMNPISEGMEDKAIQEKTAEELGIKKYYVCTNSGMLAKSDCPGQWEYAAPSNAPTQYCTGHTYGIDEEIDWEDGWWSEDGIFHANDGREFDAEGNLIEE